MGVSYATRAQVYRLVPRGTIGEAARVVASADATLDRLELAGHGFEDGDPLEFQVDQGGILPAPLALLTVYYAKLVDIGGGVKSGSLFQVSATAGGAAVDLSTVGTKPYRVLAPIDAMVDAALETFSRWIESKAPAEGVPFSTPYPSWITDAVALRTAARFVRRKNLSAFSGLVSEEEILIRDIASMMKGLRLRDSTSTSTSAAFGESVESTIDDGRGTIP